MSLDQFIRNVPRWLCLVAPASLCAQSNSPADAGQQRRSAMVPPCFGLLLLTVAAPVLAAVEVDVSGYAKTSGIAVKKKDANTLQIIWPVSRRETGEMVFDLRPDQPLIQSLALTRHGHPTRVLATQLDPATTLTIGERDRKKSEEAYKGMVFFENPRQKTHETHAATLRKKTVRVSSHGPRVTVSIGEVSAGSFTGELRFTFYCNTQLVRAETVVSTKEELRAILYDTGLRSTAPAWKKMVWLDPLGQLQSESLDATTPARPLAVKLRTVVAEGAHGAIAVFPAPHQYFYPLDFADNFQFTWFGNDYSKLPAGFGFGFGFGIRQPLQGTIAGCRGLMRPRIASIISACFIC